MAYSSQENICNGNLVSQEKEEMVQVSLFFSKERHLPSRVGLDVDDFCKLGAAFTRKSITCPEGHNSLTTANPRSKLHPPRSTTFFWNPNPVPTRQELTQPARRARAVPAPEHRAQKCAQQCAAVRSNSAGAPRSPRPAPRARSPALRPTQSQKQRQQCCGPHGAVLSGAARVSRAGAASELAASQRGTERHLLLAAPKYPSSSFSSSSSSSSSRPPPAPRGDPALRSAPGAAPEGAVVPRVCPLLLAAPGWRQPRVPWANPPQAGDGSSFPLREPAESAASRGEIVGCWGNCLHRVLHFVLNCFKPASSPLNEIPAEYALWGVQQGALPPEWPNDAYAKCCLSCPANVQGHNGSESL